MIPGISIIVFLKCKDSGIRDTAARFCFGDLLYLGARGPPRGPLEVGVVRLKCPRTLLGPHTNEARRCSAGADAGKTKPVMWFPPQVVPGAPTGHCWNVFALVHLFDRLPGCRRKKSLEKMALTHCLSE